MKTEFWAYYDPGLSFNEFIYRWAANATSQQDVPLVWSISYGTVGNASSGGAQVAQQVAAVEHNLAKLAAKGISVVVASGDSGSGYTEPDPDACCDDRNNAKGVRLSGGVTDQRRAPERGQASVGLPEPVPLSEFGHRVHGCGAGRQ